MGAGAFIPLAVFMGVVGGVGYRLLRLWRKTREAPEGLLGFGLVLMSCLAIPLAAFGRLPLTAEAPIGRLAFGVGIFCVGGGVVLIVAFTREVFRKDAAWAKTLLAVATVLTIFVCAWIAYENFAGATLAEVHPRMRPAALALLATLGVCFLWSSAESFVYYGSMRRRLALGLAEPLLVNRFFLWGFASGCTAALVCVLMACLHAGMLIVRDPFPLTAIATVGSLMSATWYLTFFPPEPYQRFIRERARPQ
jgi:hypothetical protein